MVNLFSLLLLFFLCIRYNYRDWQIVNAILLGKFVTFCRIIYTLLHEYLFIYLRMCLCLCKCIGIFFFYFQAFHYLQCASLALEFISGGIIYHHILHMTHTHTQTFNTL